MVKIVVINGNNDYLKHYFSFKEDYLFSDLTKDEIMEKYDLRCGEYHNLMKLVQDETHYEKRGKYRKYSNYEKLWDVKKVHFISRNQRMDKPSKSFYVKFNNKMLKCGGFIEPLSCEIIYDLIKGDTCYGDFGT